MRRANVFVNDLLAGVLEEIEKGKSYKFAYIENYSGDPVSLAMPVSQKEFFYKNFPPFFDGVLPEGILLEALLRQYKIDRNDFFSQLVTVGHDLVGAVTVEEIS